jgi:CRISPR-associated endonuclease Cas2
MARPKDISFSLKEKIHKIYQAGLHRDKGVSEKEYEDLDNLGEIIQKILQIIKSKPAKSTTMNYLIMYDIQDNKIRTQISKYLEKKGCIRIQKSIFMVNSESKLFQEIYQTLLEVNECYENKDSIILVPFNTSDIRSMKIIGKELHIQTLIDKPNTLFF